MSDQAAPSGRSVEIAAGPYRSVSTEVGAGLRSLTIDGRPLVSGYGADEAAPAGSGQVLAPWPNRIADGRYEFDGAPQQLALTQPGEGHAIHGLTRWSNWHLAQHTGSSATWELRLHPQPGYPHVLDLRVTYALSATAGLTVTTIARNLGKGPAPFGLGFHPYLTAGSEIVDDDVLTLAASQVLLTDRRAIPVEGVGVVDVDLDFRAGRRLGRLPLDHGFGALTREADGSTRVALKGAAGTTTLWAGPAFRWVQLFTGDSLGPARARRSLAVEPMTCPANAFVSGTDLLRLEVGVPFESSWGIRGTTAAP